MSSSQHWCLAIVLATQPSMMSLTATLTLSDSDDYACRGPA